MDVKELNPDYLNDQQLLMLRLLKNPLPEAAFSQIRQLAVKLLAKQMDETVEEWEAHNSVTEKHFEDLNKKHFRS